ncbi:MAG: RNA 2',3'-cyclic phosphodiesterase [Bacteroidota bacterium]
MKRLFVAIKLTPDDNTLSVYNSLRKAFSSDTMRWVEPSMLHLTFKFIGNTHDSKIPEIIEVIKKTVGSIGKIDFELNKVGVFGSNYNPRVIWFGVSENNKLQALGLELINNFDLAGFSKDRQNFVPHFTIARITKVFDKQSFNHQIDKVKSSFLQRARVDRIILFESILSQKSPTYNEIYSITLKD